MARRCYRGDEGSSTVFLSKTTIHSVPEKNQGPFKPHDSHASPIEVTKPSQTQKVRIELSAYYPRAQGVGSPSLLHSVQRFGLRSAPLTTPTQPCVPSQSQPDQYLRRNQNNYIIFARKSALRDNRTSYSKHIILQTCLAIVTKKMSEKNFFTLTDKGILVLQERSRRPCKTKWKNYACI